MLERQPGMETTQQTKAKTGERQFVCILNTNAAHNSRGINIHDQRAHMLQAVPSVSTVMSTM